MKRIGAFFYSIYFFLIGLLALAVTCLIAQLLTVLLRKKAPKILRKIYKISAQIMLFLQGVYPKVQGKYPKGTVIYCMNHQSNLDIAVAVAVLPSGFLFVAKEELLKTPLIGTIIKRAGYLTIDRKNARRSTESLDKIKEELQRGISVLIFPEGTRSEDGEIQKIKRGSLQVAFQTKTAIVPVINDPVFKLFSKKGLKVQHQKVRVLIAEPLTYDWENLTREYSIQSALKLENIMKTMLIKIRK